MTQPNERHNCVPNKNKHQIKPTSELITTDNNERDTGKTKQKKRGGEGDEKEKEGTDNKKEDASTETIAMGVMINE